MFVVLELSVLRQLLLDFLLESSMNIRVSDLNQNISAALSQAQDEDVIILKYGKPVAVLLGIETYQSLTQRAKPEIFNSAYDFFVNLPSVDEFELEREAFELREVDI